MSEKSGADNPRQSDTYGFMDFYFSRNAERLTDIRHVLCGTIQMCVLFVERRFMRMRGSSP